MNVDSTIKQSNSPSAMDGAHRSNRTSGAADPSGFLALLMTMGDPAAVQDPAQLEIVAKDDGLRTKALDKPEDVTNLDDKKKMDDATLLAMVGLVPAEKMSALPTVAIADSKGANGLMLQGMDLTATGPAKPGLVGDAPMQDLLGARPVKPDARDQLLVADKAGRSNEGRGRSQTQLLQQVGLQSREASVPVREAVQAAVQSMVAAVQSGDGRMPPSHVQQGARSTLLASSETVQVSSTPSALTGSGFRPIEGVGHRGAVGSEAAWGMQALLTERSTDVGQSADMQAMPSPQETAVAEQVSYWISQDIQNAELRLDPWGRDPVEVSLSLQGNEARVEFRADLPEVRQILEGALTQLEGLLQEQGLVLAGATVGTSVSQDSGARERSPRQQTAARQGNAIVATTVQIPKVHVSRMGERVLDVFA